ncbi:NADPH:quinone reductase [Acuticoccus sp. I52.16.1]|uniref:NADPH:quinone reductase n=1 Tax=Acuticoccus sp. I52.16.1 TaxID=2928472 RepID=UPI001FD36B56|nr:NADPH:quinone reductase [Acuticoccus sp. I52.16.1]UOM37289.1 NADPH:quinone reductase [Acuticoccus sp. I52.16.1]
MAAHPERMPAVRYTAFGPAATTLELVDLPVPAPGHGELLVEVKASGVNPHDTKKRSGWLGVPLPEGGVVPHSDGAGVVVAVGDGVPASRIGERVFLVGVGPENGTCARYAVAPATNAFPLPATLSFEQGASVGIPAFTGYFAVLHAGPVAGRTVLIHGGAGCVGRCAVELARYGGARVIATVSSPHKGAIARDAGAHHVLDYRNDDVAGAVAEITGGRGADLVVDVDFGANCAVDAATVAENGRVASYSSTSDRTPTLDYYAFALKGVTLHFVQGGKMPPEVRREGGRLIAALLRDGRLVPDVASVHTMRAAPAAHEEMEGGRTIGNIVVAIDP